jgi:Glycosyltransferase family 87
VRVAFVAAVAAISLAIAAAPASADDFLVPRPPPSQTVPPAGFSVSAREAIALARRDHKVQLEQRTGEPLRARALYVPGQWWVVLFRRADGNLRARVELDGRTGAVRYAARGRELGWPPITRGQHGARIRRLHVVLVLAGVLFVAPFFDPRRLWRLLNLDLLALLSLGVSFAFAEAGKVYAATPLMYPPLLYLLGRALWLAWAGGAGEARQSWAGPRLLAAALGALLAARYAWVLIEGSVNDVGYASVYGADSIRHGYELYDSAPGKGALDAYGPFMYLAYVPFTLLFPFDLAHSHTDAARAAALVWDAGTVACLYVLGRRAAGTQLGLLLAWAWAACPWTWLPLWLGTNDGLIPLLLALLLLVVARPAWRGVVLGLATAAKFGPAVLGLLLARVGRERVSRARLVYAAAGVAAFALPVVAFLPDGGLREFWDATIGFQLQREAPTSLWGLWPALEPLQRVVQATALLMAVAAFWLPRERSLERLTAAGAALLIAAQLSTVYWYYVYVAWFLPYLVFALISRSYAGSVRNSGISSASAVAAKSP